MAYFFIKARNIHHTLHMGLQSVRHHVTTGSGHFVTVTKYPDPDVTLLSFSCGCTEDLIYFDLFC